MNGALVTSAQLSLQQYWQSNSSPQVARISAMTQPWSESSTYNSMGGACWFGSQTVSTNTTGALSQSLNFNVQNIVQEWSDATMVNYGFSIYQNYTDGYFSRICPADLHKGIPNPLIARR